MSWTTSLMLAAVMWLDGGLRKAPSQSIVIRRSLLGPWRFGEIVGAGRWHAVGRWPSVMLALLTSEPERVVLSARQIRARLQLVRIHVIVLRVLGSVTSVALVIGAPIAVSRFGRTGLYAAGTCLLALGILIAFVSARACRRLGHSNWSAVRFGVAFQWPFAAPHAAERVLAVAVEGGSPVEVLRSVTSAESFAQWVRPYVYDAVHRDGSRALSLIDGFAFHLDRRAARQLLERVLPPSQADSRVCPRCGASFRREALECADCTGVELA